MASLVLPRSPRIRPFRNRGLRVLWLVGQITVGLVERGGQFALAELQVDVLYFIGLYGKADEHDAGNNGGKET
jgi:hypothetical protein